MVGQGIPGSKSAVCALKVLQKAMIFKPLWPNTGPTGGAGDALPAGTWIFI